MFKSHLTLFFLVTLSAMIMMLSCTQPAEDDYFIFGHSFGLCGGEECVETFKIIDNQIFEDTEDNYGNKGPYDFELLDKSSYNLANHLQSMLPDELKNEDDVIGCPDCYDQGGIYIEIMRNKEKSSWWMDMDSKNLPDYLHSFKDTVAATIRAIQ